MIWEEYLMAFFLISTATAIEILVMLWEPKSRLPLIGLTHLQAVYML